jgi:Ser/Thr protein kinase RdoA (MazF antagonist)
VQRHLGEKIGEGAYADVHAWAPGQVLKLFKPGVRRRTCAFEAWITRAVFAAGGPAQEVFGEVVTLEGRFGFALRRLEGPTLLQLLQAGAIAPEAAGVILATFGLAIHETPPPAELPTLRIYLEEYLRLPDHQIAEHIAAGARALIDRLPQDQRLCHCDLHPGNVIMTREGPRLIDWTGARRGGAAYDLACCHLLLTDLVPDGLGDREQQRALNAAVRSGYARLAGLSPTAITAAVEAHLPVVRLFVLLASPLSAPTRERLSRRLEADLRAEGCL